MFQDLGSLCLLQRHRQRRLRRLRELKEVKELREQNVLLDLKRAQSYLQRVNYFQNQKTQSKRLRKWKKKEVKCKNLGLKQKKKSHRRLFQRPPKFQIHLELASLCLLKMKSQRKRLLLGLSTLRREMKRLKRRLISPLGKNQNLNNLRNTERRVLNSLRNLLKNLYNYQKSLKKKGLLGKTLLQEIHSHHIFLSTRNMQAYLIILIKTLTHF